jgi:hypothetical protein
MLPDQTSALRLPRRAHTTARRGLGGLLGIMLATACGSGDPGATSTAPTPPPGSMVTAPTPPSTPSTRATTTVATTIPPVPPPATPPATSPPGATGPAAGVAELTADDVDAISAAFTLFFGGEASTVDEKVGVLENGELYRGMLEGAAADERFQQLTTEIREIRAGSVTECSELAAPEGCAIVVHDLLVSGFPMAAEVESPAVRMPGGWQLGWRAWCNVVEIGGAACPGDASGPGTPTP